MMRLSVTPSDGPIFTVLWPNYWRVPHADELLLLEQGTYRVVAVQWEIEDGEHDVQLRVVPA